MSWALDYLAIRFSSEMLMLSNNQEYLLESNCRHKIWFTGCSSAPGCSQPAPQDEEVLIKIHAASINARIPALIVLGFWFLLQLFEGTLALGTAGLGGVAFWAHIGGFVFGMLFGPLLRSRKRLPVNVRDDWRRW